MVVGPTHDGLFIECMLIPYCYLHVWLTVCEASKILQGMVNIWVVVGPTNDGLFIECMLIPYCHLHIWLIACEASDIAGKSGKLGCSEYGFIHFWCFL